MLNQNFGVLLKDRLKLSHTGRKNDVKARWEEMVSRIDQASDIARVALVGKYTNLGDSYLSVISALKHACIATDQLLHLEMINSSNLEKETKEKNPDAYEQAWNALKSCDGVIVPGGFGNRGIQGKIAAINYVREEKVPFLGICLGMQAAVIEYTRNVLGIKDANSEELVPNIPDEKAAIIFMPEGSKEKLGGTMRLGSR